MLPDISIRKVDPLKISVRNENAFHSCSSLFYVLLCSSRLFLKHMRFQNIFYLIYFKENERENDWENCEKLFTFPKSFVAKSVDGGQVRGVQVCTSLIINYGTNIFSENSMEKRSELYVIKKVLIA